MTLSRKIVSKIVHLERRICFLFLRASVPLDPQIAGLVRAQEALREALENLVLKPR